MYVTNLKLNKEEFQIYESWKLNEIKNFPNRTILYNLPPLGIGTAEAESLTGYISRLAQEHYLSPIRLLKICFREEDYVPFCIAQNSINSTLASNLNGFSQISESVVKVLQKATFDDDIRYTSLLFWRGKISNHKLLKKWTVWCPLCYEEQKSQNKPIYNKLIWIIEGISVCLIHNTSLAEICPFCKKNMKHLGNKSRPGYCSNCLKWLGINKDGFSRLYNIQNNKGDFWTTKNIAELLVNPYLTCKETNHHKFVWNLANIIEKRYHGNINDFAYENNLWHLSVRRILKSEILPTLEMILRISYSLKISAVDFFNEKSKDIERETYISCISNSKPNKIRELEIFLNEIINETPPLSANETSREMGLPTTWLKRNFPDKYEQIVERYSNYTKQKSSKKSDSEVREILINATEETPPPSLQSIFRSIGCRNTGFIYYQNFPELCRIVADRYKKANRKQFNLEAAEKALELSLKEEPPPSFSEVARRLKCSRGTLNKKFPSLATAVHERYEMYLIISRANNYLDLHKSVKKIILELKQEGQSISANKVRKRLQKRGNDKNFKNIYQQAMSEI
jgi:transcriptional regulator with XRE-family HTH domain